MLAQMKAEKAREAEVKAKTAKRRRRKAKAEKTEAENVPQQKPDSGVEMNPPS